MTEVERRDRIVREALSWRNTPFAHHQDVKGLGTDCAHMIARVYENAGEMPHIELPPYPQDIMLHRTEEIYLAGLRPYFRPTMIGRPGDLAMFRWGRMDGAQGCVVVDWPWVVGAIDRRSPRRGKVRLVDATELPLRGRLSGFWTTIDGTV